MQSLLTFTLVVFAAVAVSTGEENECAAIHIEMGECCAVKRIFPSSIQENSDVCKQKYFGDKSPTTPYELRVAFSCSVECIFSSAGLLTGDKKLDKAAVAKLFSTSATDQSPAIIAGIEQCLGSYEKNVDPSLECKSGANEFAICFGRKVFLNCPSSLWTTSSRCEELKAKLTKCPEIQEMIGGFELTKT